MNKVLTIMFTDIKGFTEKTSAQSREHLTKLLKTHEELITPVITKFGGTVIKTIGDAFMAAFESPTNAVLCAMLIQHKMKEHNLSAPDDDKIQVRVALNAGEVQVQDKDLFGEAVNIAARIEGITEATEIYFTEAVYLAMNKSEVPSSEIGWRKLKGIPEAIKVYKVIQDENSEKYSSLIKKWRSGNFIVRDGIIMERRSRRVLYIIGAGVMLLAAGAIVFYLSGQTGRQLNRVSGLISQGRALDALELLDGLKDQGVEPARFNALLIEAARKQADYLTANKRYDDLDKFFNQTEEKYGPQAGITPLRITYKLTQIQAGLGAHDRKASEMLYALFERYPENEQVLTQTASLSINQPGGSSHLARQALLKLFARDKKYVSEQAFTDFARDGLKTAYPFDHNGELARKLVADYYYDSFRSDIKSLLQSPQEYHRINAYRILSDKKDLSPAEELNYHWLTVINSTIYSDLMTQASAYFDKTGRSDGWAELKKGIDAKKYGLFPVLKQHEGKHTEAARKIFARYFMPELKDYLMQYVYDEEDSKVRVNAFRILKEANQADGVDLFRYHQTNLLDINPQYFEGRITDGLEYLKGQLTGSGKDKALELLKQSRQKLAAEIEHLKSSKAPKGYYDQGENILSEMDKLLNPESR